MINISDKPCQCQNTDTRAGDTLWLWWSWSNLNGIWIYNYLCSQCLSTIKLWVRIPLMVRCTRYIIMW